MSDLKAAAMELKSMSDDICGHPCASVVSLAARVLEALAWMEENGWRLEYEDAVCWSSEETTGRQVERGTDGSWCCMNDVFTRYRADTPLAAILAAMEGEKDGK